MARQFDAAAEAITYDEAAIKTAINGADSDTAVLTIGAFARCEATGSDAVIWAMNQPEGVNNDSALELHLKLDESSGTVATDSSANGRNGTLSSSSITWVSGKHNNAAQWPGSGTDNITVNAAALNGHGDFSIGVNFQWATASGNQSIFATGTGDECRLYVTSSGNIGFYYKGAMTSWAAGISTATTYALVLTFDNATNTAELHLNDASQGTRVLTGSTDQTISTSDDVYIGWREGGNTTHTWTGWIDDFRIYSRTLGSSEITLISDDPYDASAVTSQEGFLLERIDSDSSLRATYTNSTGSSATVSTAASSFPGSTEYEPGESWPGCILVKYDGANTRIGIAIAGGSTTWTTDAAVIPTTLDLPSGAIKLAANTLGGASEKPFTGSLQDFFIVKGEFLTTAEETALADSEVDLALQDTTTTKVFHAKLSGFDDHVSDSVAGHLGTYTSEPKRTLGPPVSRLNWNPTIVVDQDSQAYSTSRYAIWGRHRQRYASSLNVAMSAHPGDLLNSASQSEATAARAAYAEFSGQPFLFALGNHDMDGDGLLTRAVTLISEPFNLPPSLMSQQSSYQGQCGTTGQDAYCQSHIVTIGTDKWHFMTLPFGETEKQRDWAVAQEAKIAAANPGIKTWLITHGSSNLAGELFDDSHEGASSGSLLGTDFYQPARTSNPYLASESERPIATGGSYGEPGTGTWITHLSKMSTLAVVQSGHDVVGTRKCGIVRMHGEAGNSVDFICLNDQETGTNSDGDGLLLFVSVNGNTLTADMYNSLTDTFLPSETNGTFELVINEAVRQPESNIHLRRNRPAGHGMRRKLSARHDGVYLTNEPIKLRAASINTVREAQVFSVDTSPLFDPLYVYEVGTPEVIGASSLKAEAVGPRDQEAMVALSGEGIGGEKLTVRFPVTMDTGRDADPTDVVVIDQVVEVMAD